MSDYAVLLKSFLGSIDLAIGEPRLRAQQHYHSAHEGLLRAWRGRMLLDLSNLQHCSDWVSRLIREYETDSVTEAVAILPAHPSAGWFHLGRPYTRCYLRDIDQPVAILYLGLQQDRFIEMFAPHGDIELGISDDEPEMVVRTRPASSPKKEAVSERKGEAGAKVRQLNLLDQKNEQ